MLKPGRKVAFAVSKQTKGFVFCTLPDLGGIEVCPRPCLSIDYYRNSMLPCQLPSTLDRQCLATDNASLHTTETNFTLSRQAVIRAEDVSSTGMVGDCTQLDFKTSTTVARCLLGFLCYT